MISVMRNARASLSVKEVRRSYCHASGPIMCTTYNRLPLTLAWSEFFDKAWSEFLPDSGFRN